MNTFRILADVQMLPIFTCADCGSEQVGSAFRTEIKVRDADALAGALKNISLRAHDMPIGWASYSDGFRCMKCKK